MDRRTIKQPYIPYEEIEDGFRIINKDGETTIEFEKSSVFTDDEFRNVIIERYKNNPIEKVCQTCKRECKQVKTKDTEFIKNISFKCFI